MLKDKFTEITEIYNSNVDSDRTFAAEIINAHITERDSPPGDGKKLTFESTCINYTDTEINTNHTCAPLNRNNPEFVRSLVTICCKVHTYCRNHINEYQLKNTIRRLVKDDTYKLWVLNNCNSTTIGVFLIAHQHAHDKGWYLYIEFVCSHVGYGTDLLKHVCTWCEQDNTCVGVELHAINDVVKRLYKQCGFCEGNIVTTRYKDPFDLCVRFTPGI